MKTPFADRIICPNVSKTPRRHDRLGKETVTERLAMPSDPAAVPVPDTLEVLDRRDMHEDRPWEGVYLAAPHPVRVGIACSGGGIRSASYCLGALQVLTRAGVLGDAEHLACVSGGGYISIAHAVMIDQTLKQAKTDGVEPPDSLFAGSPAWGLGSPEEQHLRANLDYLAPGFAGKLWALANGIYGLLKHVLPFGATLFIASYVLGLAYHGWIGPSLRSQNRRDGLWWPDIAPLLWVPVTLLAVTGILLFIRQRLQQSTDPSGEGLSMLQRIVVTLDISAFVATCVLIVVPIALLWLSHRPFDINGVWTVSGLAVAAAKAVSYLARRGILKRLLPFLAPIVTALVIVGPLVGFTYWCTQSAVPDRMADLFDRPQTWLLVGSVVFLVGLRWFDEVTSVPHLYYRERLATAFVGRRRAPVDSVAVRYEQPPWSMPIRFSEVDVGSQPFPNLVVCATANLSRDVPLGRAGASFTFEKDFSGSPVTGYLSTPFVEDLAGSGTLTLPALMAISGAAVAPSMGKMTRPALRFLMALFDLRLGVWLPNPFTIEERLTTREVREARAASPEADRKVPRKSEAEIRARRGRYQSRTARPGALYVFREAFGLNSLGRRFVYTTDGGHFDNLGLVELLRRGCGLIVCFDAAGDDVRHFFTLSEALALARAELGVDVRLDVGPLMLNEETGFSPSDHAVGTIAYPDGTEGVLIFCKAAMPFFAPLDLKSYRQVEPAFPAHGTIDQFFDERSFESYRALGALAATGALGELVKLGRVRSDRVV
jgi:hypothetical protein